MKKDFFASLGILVLFAFSLFSFSSPISAEPVEEIYVCHFQPAENNPWTVLLLPLAALEGHDQHAGDIIDVQDVNLDGKTDELDCEGIGGGECLIEQKEVTLISPTNGATDITSVVTFDWEAVPGAIKYQVLVKEGSSGNTPVVYQSTTDSLQVTLSPNKTYFWMVRAFENNDTNCFAQSNEFSLKTAATVIDNGDDDGIGGGVAVIPSATVTSDGIGGGTVATDGIGGGALPNTGSLGMVFATAISALGAIWSTKKFAVK